MKAGSIVRLIGNTWSSYERQGEMGLLIAEIDEQKDYGEVMWFQDATVGVAKLNHLEIVCETR